MNLMETIWLNKSNFSKTERKVFDYIVNNPEHIGTYTITKLADLTQTSTSAILRFCQVLGFNGYKDFRYAMIEYLKSNYQNPSIDVVDNFIDGYSNVLDQLKTLDRKTLNKLANSLKDNSTNFLVGIFLSSLPVQALHHGLQDLDVLSHYASDHIAASHLANNVTKDSTLVYFSFSGSTDNFTRFFSTLINDMPQESYLITSNPNAKLIKQFTHTIVLPGKSLASQSIIDLQSIQLFFVELLLNTIYQKLGDTL
ncbi:MurR/RpiR family transcriptional regulator [Tetragenococcus halophilus]|uniref:MurR/RpiR family transcriptional regulator n=1 Tax=Tetragenococcus halophilus TaxID=51669 RepID=UPI0015B8A22E|nr:MurR/RpiR family transcriptional regulator [Tetragenococcus halophilus]NWO01200.1 MurR/RpiR family transcriptional regulator [Tetragenococcus halophilus]